MFEKDLKKEWMCVNKILKLHDMLSEIQYMVIKYKNGIYMVE